MSNPTPVNDRPKVVVRGIKIRSVDSTGDGKSRYDIILTFEPTERRTSFNPEIINHTHMIFVLNTPKNPHFVPCSILANVQPVAMIGTDNECVYSLETDFEFSKDSEVEEVLFGIETSLGPIINLTSNYELV